MSPKNSVHNYNIRFNLIKIYISKMTYWSDVSTGAIGRHRLTFPHRNTDLAIIYDRDYLCENSGNQLRRRAPHVRTKPEKVG